MPILRRHSLCMAPKLNLQMDLISAPDQPRKKQFYHYIRGAKGQIKPKAGLGAVDSPKKQTNRFDLFAVKTTKANKQIRWIVLCENLWRLNLLSVLSDL